MKKKRPSSLRKTLKQSNIKIWMFDGVANWIFPKKSHSYKMKSQVGNFHELLPGNLVFFHFYYIGTKDLGYLDQTTPLYSKSYASTEIFKSGIQNLSRLFRDQAVIIYQWLLTYESAWPVDVLWYSIPNYNIIKFLY